MYKRPASSTSVTPKGQRSYRRSGGGQTSQKANKVHETAQEPKKEFAGNASALSSSTPTGLQSNTDLHWLADTGATSHMTPHYAWMHNYTPYIVDIHLADNTIVQSAGIGSVVLNPVVGGSDLRPVKLTRGQRCAIVVSAAVPVVAVYVTGGWGFDSPSMQLPQRLCLMLKPLWVDA